MKNSALLCPKLTSRRVSNQGIISSRWSSRNLVGSARMSSMEKISSPIKMRDRWLQAVRCQKPLDRLSSKARLVRKKKLHSAPSNQKLTRKMLEKLLSLEALDLLKTLSSKYPSFNLKRVDKSYHLMAPTTISSKLSRTTYPSRCLKAMPNKWSVCERSTKKRSVKKRKTNVK